MQTFELFIGTQFGLVLSFLATATLVVVAGIWLSLYGDALGDRTGLGNGLIGLIFLAGVTSLPELVVSLTSVLKATSFELGADLAIGNMLGSNVFNLLILALMALLFTNKFKPQEMDNPHTHSTVYGVVMLLIFAGSYFTSSKMDYILPGIHSSIGVLLLPAIYLIILFREHQQHSNSLTEDEVEEKLPAEDKLSQLSSAHFYTILSTLCGLIILGGIFLSILGSRMALPTSQGGFGLEASLIGTLFLAISTSLPELAISFASIRLGFLDMAVGNVLGSNMFNLLIIFVADVAMRKENILSHASSQHWTSVALILLLTIAGAILLRCRQKKVIISTALIMLLLYISAMVFFT